MSLRILLAGALLVSAGSGAAAAPEGRLAPCPSAPHCVSSHETGERHGIASFVLRDNADSSWNAVAEAVRAGERTTVVQQDARYLRAEVKSPWGIYTDDLELLRDPASGRIDVRSSSRVGYYDFKVNRKRVEALRARLAQAGLIR